MKMSQERYNLLKEEMTKRINYYGGMGQLQCNADVVNPMITMWQLHNATVYDIMYDDEHPAFKAGRPRISQQVPGFSTYKDNGTELFDAHIVTALRKLGKEFGIIKD